jgi:hypothetical protein
MPDREITMEWLTPDHVRRCVEDLRRLGGPGADHEGCHAMEDDIWRDVLRAIADGAPNPAELARAALETNGIEFERWCA